MRSRKCNTRLVRRLCRQLRSAEFSSDGRRPSLSFTFNEVRFVGLDEYVQGNVSAPAVSKEDLNAFEASQLPSGVKSTVVFGHVPDQSPTTTKPRSPGRLLGRRSTRICLLNGQSFFKVDINGQRGLYYFAGHDHGYFRRGTERRAVMSMRSIIWSRLSRPPGGWRNTSNTPWLPSAGAWSPECSGSS